MTYPHTPMDLDIWLVVATEGLTMESDRRVRAEITAHYQDALDAAREAGLCEIDAARAALAELGKPEAARDKFRKAYLWRGDEERLRDLERWRTRTLKEQVRALGGTVAVGIIIILVFNYGLGLEWSGTMVGLTLIFSNRISNILNWLRARFVFSLSAQDAERRFRNAVTWFWGVVILFTLAFFVTLWAYASPYSRTILLPLLAFIACIALLLWRLLVAHECEIYLPLMRKVREQNRDRFANNGGPERHA